MFTNWSWFQKGRAFYGSAVESIRLPFMLERIETETFGHCKNLRVIEVPFGVEYIGEACFKNSGIEEITLPGTLEEMAEDAFADCKKLKTVRVEEGCRLDVRKYVGKSVDVWYK